MQGLRYTSRGLRRRNNTDKWEVTLSHVDPVTGETVRTFHTVDAKTKKGAEKARDALIWSSSCATRRRPARSSPPR